MKKKFDRVYQFKITLQDIRPPIWRRIQVPETYSFWDLHVAIQDSMGWMDSHLHQFTIMNPSTGRRTIIGIPDEETGGEDLPGWEHAIADYFSLKNARADYLYDFGDSWEHTVELEKILAREKNNKYPLCIDGKRACPPEDVGGVWGYENFLEIIEDPQHEEHQDMLNWIGEGFDPEHFHPAEVHFDDPDKRWGFAFGGRF
jgi:hypothetical protein